MSGLAVGLLVWIAVSFPAGVLIGKALKRADRRRPKG